jgi:hypothetical protein
MPKNVAFMTAEQILPESFLEMARIIGANDVSEKPGENRIHLGRDNQNIWAYFDPDEIGYLEAPVLKRIEELIHNAPKTCVNIEISREGNSDRLAIEFANYLLHKFSGIVYDFKGRVYSSAEVAKMIICESEPIL